jgi:multidrug efflux pump subunit AcrA (membrane-fusion protein)
MPTEVAAPTTPSRNGELIDRVEQLRLDSQLGRGAGGGGRGAWLPWVLCGLMAVAWAGVGVRWYKTAGKPGDAAAGDPKAGGPPPAGVIPPPGGKPPEAAAGELVTQLKGTVIPSLQINLSPDDVSGVVEEIFFKEGDRVAKGKVLARIRSARYQNDYDSARANLEAARHRLADLTEKAVRPEERKQAEAELDEARAAWERADLEVKRVYQQKATGVVSKQDLEKAETDLKGAKARVDRLQASLDLLNLGARRERLDAARAEVAAAEARYTEAARMLANCEVKAPIDGTVLTKVADQGVLVSPMSFNVAAGICSMADLSKLEVEIDVPERQITRIKQGQECLVQADADPARGYRGVVDRVMPIADDTKNVVKVRIRVYLPKGEGAGAFLKPKMSATATVYNRDFKLDPAKDQPWGDEPAK